MIKTVILCGGKGTRAYPHTIELPKPLLEVGDRPVLAHLMAIYASQGFRDFVLAAGYKRDLIQAFAAEMPHEWEINVADTGEDTNTGARVRCCADRVGDVFFTTYADGLGDVDLHALLAFHRSHRGAATLTTVPLPSQYGTVDIDGENRVNGFREKPRLPDHRINAGFFVFDRRVFEMWDGDDLEREVLPSLSSRGELFAFHHHGFWKSMDTFKDALDLSALCLDGHPPWAVSAARNVG
jgi:glucose-1-phosphate cytidylyltransferase